MGTWTLVIEGHGICGNGTDKDADEMGAAFVRLLRQTGHAEVKGYFCYGPKLATSQIETTMRRTHGCYDKMAIPLAALCDHRTWHDDNRGGWAEPCKSMATVAQVMGPEVVTLRCAEHDIEPLNPDYRKLSIPGWKKVKA